MKPLWITTEALNIIDDYLPLVCKSNNYRLDIIDVVFANQDWANRLIDFVEMHYINDTGDVSWIAQTIMHDIGGLMKNDEHFLPRI